MLLVGALVCLPNQGDATLAHIPGITAGAGVITCNPPNNPNNQQEQQEYMACQECAADANSAASQARAASSQAAGQEAGQIASGSANSAANGGMATGQQATGVGSQMPNAGNMCGGRDSQLARQGIGQGLIPALDDCSQKAKKCEKNKKQQGAKKMKDACDDAKKQTQKENNDRGKEAQEMGQKCDQSKQNENKMPQLQPPQMPQKQDDKKPEEQPPYDPADMNTGTGTSTDTESTVQIDTVKFDDNSKTGTVDVKPKDGPSGLSGNQASGPEHGFGAHGPTMSPGSDGFKPPSNGASAITKVSGGGGMGGFGGDGKLGGGAKDGIAGADIKPESYEVNMGSGKSMLGLRGGKGDDEEGATTANAGTGKLPGKGDDGKGGKGGGAAGASNASGNQSDGSLTLFQMIQSRYRNLRELGQI